NDEHLPRLDVVTHPAAHVEHDPGHWGVQPAAGQLRTRGHEAGHDLERQRARADLDVDAVAGGGDTGPPPVAVDLDVDLCGRPVVDTGCAVTHREPAVSSGLVGHLDV